MTIQISDTDMDRMADMMCLHVLKGRLNDAMRSMLYYRWSDKKNRPEIMARARETHRDALTQAIEIAEKHELKQVEVFRHERDVRGPAFFDRVENETPGA